MHFNNSQSTPIKFYFTFQNSGITKLIFTTPLYTSLPPLFYESGQSKGNRRHKRILLALSSDYCFLLSVSIFTKTYISLNTKLIVDFKNYVHYFITFSQTLSLELSYVLLRALQVTLVLGAGLDCVGDLRRTLNFIIYLACIGCT